MLHLIVPFFRFDRQSGNVVLGESLFNNQELLLLVGDHFFYYNSVSSMFDSGVILCVEIRC